MAASSKDEPRTNLIGDPRYSDGLRTALFFKPRPYSLAELEVLDWEPVPSLSHTRQNVSVIEREESR